MCGLQPIERHNREQAIIIPARLTRDVAHREMRAACRLASDVADQNGRVAGGPEDLRITWRPVAASARRRTKP